MSDEGHVRNRAVERTQAGTAATAVATILFWVLNEYAGITPPPPVIAAGSVLIGIVVQWIYSAARK